MGYYTDFTIRIEYKGVLIEPKTTVLFALNPAAMGKHQGSYGFGVIIDNYGYSNLKWYDDDDDMCKISADFGPDFRFELTGIVEETGDYWKKLYHNGKIVASWVATEIGPDLFQTPQA